MSWSIDTKKTGSINDGSSKLPVGTQNFQIVEAASVADKQDQTGRRRQVVITLKARDGRTYKTYLSPMAENETQANIAQRTLVAFFESCGISAKLIKPELLPKLKGKVVSVTVTETQGKGTNAGKTYTNIQTVEAAADEDEGEEEETEQQEEESEEEETPEASEESDEEEEEEEPVVVNKAKKPAAKASPWG